MAASEENPIKSTFTPPAWLLQKAKENAARLGYRSDALSKELQDIRANPEEAAKKAKEHAAKMGVDAAAVRKIMAAQNPRPFMKIEELSLDERRSASAEAEVMPSHEADIQMELDEMSTSEQASPAPILDRRTASVEQEPIPSMEVDIQASTERSVMQQGTSAPKSRSTSSSAPESDQSREVVMQPTVSPPPIAGLPISKLQKPSVKSSPSKRRDVQVEKRDDRRAKKEVARVKQAKALIKKSASKSLSPTTESPAVSTSAFAAVQKAVRTKALSKSASKSASPAAASPTIAETSAAGAAREAAAIPGPMEVDHSPSLFVGAVDRYPVPTSLPKWCTDIKDTGFNMKRLDKKRPQSLASLESLKNCIGRCEVEMKRVKLNALYEELRDHVHKAEFLNEDLSLMPFVLKKARILSPENGLPRIFKETANFPSDLKADSYWLYNRWCKEDFAQDILRGIVTVKGKDRNGDRIDTVYRTKFPTNAKYHGTGDLVLGQWWPTQLCTVRDGAHGTPQGGIYGDKEEGAYSIVLSGGGYHDKDDGDIIQYSGTDGKNFTPTDVTLAMMKSKDTGKDIRVIRSGQLHKKNPYRPTLGLRYDGLYTVKDFELVDKEKQIHRFLLERCPGQEAIRCGDHAAERPTRYEIMEYERNKEKWV
jgi:hypothetical protein